MSLDRLASEHQLGQPVFRLEGRKFASLPRKVLVWITGAAVFLALLAIVPFFSSFPAEAWAISFRFLTIAGVVLLIGILSFFILQAFNKVQILALFDRGLIYRSGTNHHTIPYA